MNQEKLKRNINNLLSSNDHMMEKTKKQQKTFLQIYSSLCQQKQYQYARDQQIKQQNRKLKIGLIEINRQVDQAIKNIQPRIQKKMSKVLFIERNKQRTKTDAAQFLSQNTLQHRKKVQGMQASNNQFILKVYKNEFKRLKERQKFILAEEDVDFNYNTIHNDEKQIKSSNASGNLIANSRIRQRLQSNIDETVGQITKTKIANKKIKQRNKTLGNSIHHTDQFMSNMRRLQQQVNFEQKNKKKLIKQLQLSQTKVKDIYRKLQQIKSQSDNAQQYLQKVQKKQRSKQQNKQKQQQLKKKHQAKHFIQKKKQFQLQNKQILYHNLLKNLDVILQSTKATNDKINKIEEDSLELKKEMNDLEAKLHKIRRQKRQRINKKKTGFMILSNQLFSQSDIKSQHSSIPLKQHSSSLQRNTLVVKPNNTQPQTQKYSQNNYNQNSDQIYQMLQQKPTEEMIKIEKKPIKYVNNQSST